jgi:hypothetical protein
VRLGSRPCAARMAGLDLTGLIILGSSELHVGAWACGAERRTWNAAQGACVGGVGVEDLIRLVEYYLR